MHYDKHGNQNGKSTLVKVYDTTPPDTRIKKREGGGGMKTLNLYLKCKCWIFLNHNKQDLLDTFHVLNHTSDP